MNPNASNEAGQLPDVAVLNEALGKLGKHFLLSRKQVLEGARESLNKLGGNDYLRRFKLVSSALNATANENPAIRQFVSLMDNDFREFTDRESALNDVVTYHCLRRVLDEMEVYATNPSLYHRTIGGIGGGFSSGKSAFINSLLSSDTTVKLAEGIRPVTAIPSYVLSNPHTAIQGINNKGASFDIALDIYSNISHELLKELPYLRDILPYIIVSAPMSSNGQDNLAFIDTPGYNPSAVGLAENDPETAREYIKDASFLIWMVGLDSNGTIPQSDLEFLSKLGFGQTEERQLYVVANKAELKPASDIEDILNTFEECLDDYDLQYAGITAYSAKMKKVFSSRGKELFEFIAENNVKRNHYGNLLENLYSAFRPYVEEIYRDDQEKKQYRKATQDLLLEALKMGAINAETDSRLEQGLSALESKFIQPEKLEDRLERVAILFDHFVGCVEIFALEVGMDKLDVSRWRKKLFTKPISQTTEPILPTSSHNKEANKTPKKTSVPVSNPPSNVVRATKAPKGASNRSVLLIALIGAFLGGFYLGSNPLPFDDTTALAIVTKPENPQVRVAQLMLEQEQEEAHQADAQMRQKADDPAEREADLEAQVQAQMEAEQARIAAAQQPTQQQVAVVEDIPTRFGSLKINGDNMLLYNNRPLNPEIKGNNSLSTVGTYQIGSSDVVLIQDNGGTACPALLYFLSISNNGVMATSPFGTCSDLIKETQVADTIYVEMPGFMGPFEPEAEKIKAAKEWHIFIFKDGVLTRKKTSIR